MHTSAKHLLLTNKGLRPSSAVRQQAKQTVVQTAENASTLRADNSTFLMISSRVGTAETSGRAFLAPLMASLPSDLGFLVKSTSGVALSTALPTSLGFLAPMGSPPPASSFPVSFKPGRSSVFLFNLSRACWLVAVLGNKVKASAGPAAYCLICLHDYNRNLPLLWRCCGVW